jgi:pimeloyl-ACP methyl ester carboxylesterase
MGKVTSKDGTSIAFDQSGQGSPIILVDGAMCSRSFGPMTPLSKLLAPHFTVFTYDRRGRGESSDTAPYAVAREVEDIEALIKQAGGSAFVYGISSGAALAIEAAARGLPIEKLALYEPPFVSDSRPDLPKDHVKALTELTSSGRRGDAVEYFMTQMVGMPAEFVAPMRQAPMWPGLEAVAHTLAYDASIMGDYSVPTRRLGSVAIPTLVMDGGESPAQLRNAVQAVANAIPNAQRRTLPGQTHEVAAEAIAPVLIEFFTR